MSKLSEKAKLNHFTNRAHYKPTIPDTRHLVLKCKFPMKFKLFYTNYSEKFSFFSGKSSRHILTTSRKTTARRRLISTSWRSLSGSHWERLPGTFSSGVLKKERELWKNSIIQTFILISINNNFQFAIKLATHFTGFLITEQYLLTVLYFYSCVSLISVLVLHLL